MVLRRDRNDEVVHVIVDGGGDVYTVDVEKDCGRKPAEALVPINQRWLDPSRFKASA